MLNLVILLVVAILLSIIVNKDIDEVIPPFLFTVLVGIYVVAILGKSHHSLLLSFFGFAGIWILYIIKQRRVFPTFGEIKAKFTPLPIGFLAYLLVCVIFILLYSNRFVIGWDDLHYAATFPKDMFYYGTMPVGSNSCTRYRDYLPLLQLFFYWGFQGIRNFSEPLMFQYKIVLIFTCMLPFFKLLTQNKGVKRICILIMTIILPYTCLIEILDGLSMDTVMALFFGYALVAVFERDKCDWFYYYKIISALLVLVLIKSIALMFAGFVIVIWFIVELYDFKEKDKKGKIFTAAIFFGGSLLTGAAYGSWKIFCIKNGNSTYLSDILSNNLDTGVNRMALPEYGMDTIRGFVTSLATLSTNLGKTGFTVLTATIFIIILCIILEKNQVFTKKDIWCYLLLGIFFVIYLAFLLYTYLFIFEQWEAESLSSLDRYYGTYILVLLYITLYRVYQEKIKKEKLVLLVLTGVVLLSLNHTRVFNYMVPTRYEKQLQEAKQMKETVENETNKIDIMSMTKGTVMIVNKGTNDFYSRYMNYYFIPVVSDDFNIEDYDSEELAEQLKEKLIDRKTYYVYFTDLCRENIDEKAIQPILGQQVELKESTLYYFDSDAGILQEALL